MRKLLAAVGFVIVMTVAAGASSVDREGVATAVAAARTFGKVASLVERHYVDPTTEAELYHRATRLMVSSLRDPYAELLAGERLREYRDQIGEPRGDLPGAVPLAALSEPVLLDGDIGYVQLHGVAHNVARQLAAAVDRLRSAGARSLVIDLRGNRGGLIVEGVELAGLFLARGDTVAVTRGRTAEHSRTFVTTAPSRWAKMPLVLLVDGTTASAAELFATALQDHDRAMIIGEPTYGKGVVQSTFDLGTEMALKITTSRWYGPSGRSIQRLRASELERPVTAVVAYASAGGRPLPANEGVRPDLRVSSEGPLADPQAIVAANGRGDPPLRAALTLLRKGAVTVPLRADR